jgi:AbrB family looped-hinge helix DNA binding protein
METLTVSSKGQISIPKALREKLNLRKGSRLSIRVDRERIILSKAADWRSMRGMAAGAGLLEAHRADKEQERQRERRRP